MAVQLIKGVSRIVIFLSRALGSVRLAITPGTVQPKPISIGTMLLPESPSFLSGLSITKAIRAMYPVSSSRERKKKSTTIMGRKLSTLPTPVKTPSISRECNVGLTCQAVSTPSAQRIKA